MQVPSVSTDSAETTGPVPARSSSLQARSRYTLDELLAKCDLSAPLTSDFREWLDAPPVGLELV